MSVSILGHVTSSKDVTVTALRRCKTVVAPQFRHVTLKTIATRGYGCKTLSSASSSGTSELLLLGFEKAQKEILRTYHDQVQVQLQIHKTQ
ncbi:predicted protein [Sclerotinia sclerotiorum 1980 UF-70]|uniref:Uncharacterized protein n=1 Tax=Sclerotinia sclerotiorum (strain ATCC 18683 / 1980 / Ss-1) TaxID=665079 RepID=A7EKN2_SCLS1|nr:predicted protein [Sclerotinia sclerotiorum 1980 UF-70]EDO03398.1 predicted protein [Sclerotinia sclerotiorum 1980 UF-70]